MLDAGQSLVLAAAAGDAVGPLPGILFYLFAAVTVGGAIAVALARNIVRAAVGLLFALSGMAGLYLLLNAEFIAAVQLVVYVGGTLILIVFGVMLTNRTPVGGIGPKWWEVLWALVIAALLALPLVGLMVTAAFPQRPNVLVQSTYPLDTLGKALLDPQGFLVPFELVSVLLLAVMIGAAYLAKARKKRDGGGMA